MKRSTKFLLPLLLISSLTSCSSNSYHFFRGDGYIIMPSGAPTLAIFNEVSINEEVIIETTTSNVLAQFASNEYKYIIFDANQGLNQIETNNANYTFIKLLTGGNFHLVKLNPEAGTYPTNNDYVLGFGTDQQIPNKVYNKLFPNAPFDYAFNNGVSDLQGALKGIDENGYLGIGNARNQIDWVFIAQPALFGLINSTPNFKALYEVSACDYLVTNLVQEQFNYDYIPQAGLFVNTSYYNNNREEVVNFLNYVEFQLNLALNHPEVVRDVMNEYSENLEAQQSRFGFNANIAYALQSNSNQFGIVDPNYEFNYNDLKDFNEFLNPASEEANESNTND